MADRSSAPLRIALVLATSTGGVGRHVRGVARGLAGRSQSVAVLGPRSTDHEFAFEQRLLADDDVKFRSVEIGSGLPMFGTLKAAWRLRRLTRHADVVHAHGVRAAAVAAVGLARIPLHGRLKRGPAFVITFHNAMLGPTFRRRVLRFGMARLARAADAVFVVSDDLAVDLGSVARVRRAAVCADPPVFSRDVADVRSRLGLDADTPIVLAIGRLHVQKGFDVLIDAAAALRDAAADAVVLIAGEGPERTNLEQRLQRSKGNVRLLGHRVDTADLIRAADVVVMPSRWEGWPLAAAEVLAVGSPLIATDVGGLPELVGDAAVVVPSDSAAELTTAIIRVLADPVFAADLAQRAQRRAGELPTHDDVVDQLLVCYRALVRNEPSVAEAAR